ncbi:MAG: TlpA disulfide reductase family protein [Burkholderiales bacterium]
MQSRHTFRIFLPLLGLIAVVGGVLTALTRPGTVPDVSFIEVKGKNFSLSSLQGKVVLVNFWATSCAVCVKEMSRIVQIHEKYRERGFETVAVAMSYDPPNRVAAYAQQNNLPFRVTLDIYGKAMEAFGGIRGTPTTFLVDKRGRIVWRHEGEPDFEKLGVLIEKELAKG